MQPPCTDKAPPPRIVVNRAFESAPKCRLYWWSQGDSNLVRNLGKCALNCGSMCFCVVTRVLFLLLICLCVLRDVTLLNRWSPGFRGFRLAGTQDGRERQCGWSRGEAILSESVARELRRPYYSAQPGHRHTARRRSS